MSAKKTAAPARLRPTRESGQRQDKLIELGRTLPEATVEPVGRQNEHLTFRVRKKTFAYYAFDHHGDGRIALLCKAGPGEQGRLVEESPRRFFVPPYVGRQGWVGLRLDGARVNWAEVAFLLRAAYRLTAPRTLAARLG